MHCHEMRKGEIYYCEGCGLEVQVTKECKDVGKPSGDCCHHTGDQREFMCCGEEMKKKQ